METRALHKPKILVPYGGPEPDPDFLDIFVYLRPESNGVAVESAILSVIKECRKNDRHVKLIYMANMPGDYIVSRKIIEHHYSLRLFFAVHGGRAFTPDMVQQFEEAYGAEFRNARVIGAFEALRRFAWTPEELFELWVEEAAVFRIAGQVVKRYRDVWIVNYDVPALLHKNSAATDIAVMTFRTREGYRHFFELAAQMKHALVERGLLRQGMPIARAVHISRSPFEQLLDTRDYLLTPDGAPAGLEASSFAQFLMARGIDLALIRGLIEHPICTFDFGFDKPSEQHLMDLCEGFTYTDGWHILQRVSGHILLRHPTAPGVRM